VKRLMIAFSVRTPFCVRLTRLTLCVAAAVLSGSLFPLALCGRPIAVQEPRCIDTPLLAAIHKRDPAVAIQVIQDRAELNAKPCGVTALAEAIVEDQTEVVEELLSKGASPNVLDSRNTSPLMAAAFYCRENFVPLLLKHGAKIDSPDIDGYSALMWSTQNCKNGTMVSVLLRYGAKVNLRTQDGSTALSVAAFYGNEDAVHVLVAAGADINAGRRGETALTIARDRDVGRRSSHDRIYAFLLEVSRLDTELKRSGNK
jgi:ankyrin repeat protein